MLSERAKEFAIEHFVCISVNPREANERPLLLDAIESMKKYLGIEVVTSVCLLPYFFLVNRSEDPSFHIGTRQYRGVAIYSIKLISIPIKEAAIAIKYIMAQ